MLLFLLAVLQTNWVVTCVLLFFAICLSAYELVYYIERGNRVFADFLLSIQNSDFTRYNTIDKQGRSFGELKQAFNTIIDAFRQARIAKEEQYAFLQTVMSHISTGIVCFDETGDIKLVNDTALGILNLPSIRNINLLQKLRPELFEPLMNGNNEVIEATIKEEQQKLLLRSAVFKLQGQEHTLVLITNVKTEIDKAETEAWRQLLQVLTHEIMNSVTPISSLSDTIKVEFDKIIKQESFSTTELDDLSEGLSVIKNRSAGLISFVHQYKSLINVPKPVLKPTPIVDMLNRVQLLTMQYLQGQGINMVVVSPLQNAVINADVHMIEQVILNLLYNAADALKDIAAPRIVIACEERAGNIIITVSDNGRGVDKDIEDKIFIPFFTTKSQGTGVGLSLSKQIMHMHGGNIGVHSSSDTGTVFTLSFSK